MRFTLMLSLLVLACATLARAQELWPAPPGARPLSTDRPDRTESPFTVPAGWLQIEADLVSHGEFKQDDRTVTGTGVASFNLKYGVTRRMDLQFLLSPWARLHSQAPGIDETESGTGQAGLRAKFNLSGNDRGDMAAALLPFVSIPTRGDGILDAATYGMLLPVAAAVTENHTLSSMLGAMRVENDEWWVIGSVAVGMPVAGAFASFLEVYVARAGFDESALEDVTGDVGLTYAASDNWQLDAGLYYGLTDPTEDWRVFVGASGRFDLSR